MRAATHTARRRRAAALTLGRALRRHQRLHKLQELRWEVGKLIPAEQKQLCSQREQEFSQEYNASLDRYMNDVGLDLTSDQAPPRGVFIDVLALEDLGIPGAHGESGRGGGERPQSDGLSSIENFARTTDLAPTPRS